MLSPWNTLRHFLWRMFFSHLLRWSQTLFSKLQKKSLCVLILYMSFTVQALTLHLIWFASSSVTEVQIKSSSQDVLMNRLQTLPKNVRLVETLWDFGSYTSQATFPHARPQHFHNLLGKLWDGVSLVTSRDRAGDSNGNFSWFIHLHWSLGPVYWKCALLSLCILSSDDQQRTMSRLVGSHYIMAHHGTIWANRHRAHRTEVALHAPVSSGCPTRNGKTQTWLCLDIFSMTKFWPTCIFFVTCSNLHSYLV